MCQFRSALRKSVADVFLERRYGARGVLDIALILTVCMSPMPIETVLSRFSEVYLLVSQLVRHHNYSSLLGILLALMLLE